MNDFIYQTNKYDCGFACLKMLLSITFKSSDYLYIPSLKIENQDYSLLDLKNIATNYGATLETIKYETLDEINLDKPFIYIKNNEEGNKHAILVKKKYKKRSLIYDPDKGKKIVNNDDFYSENEHIVTFVKSYTNTNYKSEVLFDKTNLIFLTIFQISSILLIFFGMFMVDQSSDKKKLIFSILFIALGLIISLTQRLFTYKIMEEYDNKFLAYTHDNNLKILKENFKLMHETKSYMLVNDSKILSNLIVAIFINIALIFNNNKFIYVSILTLVLIIIDILYINIKLKNNKEEINKNENELLTNIKTLDEYTSSYDNLKKETYRYAKLIDLKKLIYFSLIFVISFVLFMFSQDHLISTLILYFFSGSISYNYLNESIELIENNKSNIINKTKFLTLVNSKKKVDK